jgi:hypothetical protein
MTIKRMTLEGKSERKAMTINMTSAEETIDHKK